MTVIAMMKAAGLVLSALLGSLHSHSAEGTLEEPRGNRYGSLPCAHLHGQVTGWFPW